MPKNVNILDNKTLESLFLLLCWERKLFSETQYTLLVRNTFDNFSFYRQMHFASF